MRVANNTIYEAIKYNLAHIADGMNKANAMVSSGKRITKLSDDPLGLAQSLNIKSSLANISQLGRNMGLGKTWLTATESALSNAQDLLSEAKVLAVQMATATQDASARSAAAVTIDNILSEVIALGNVDVNGRYIFAGSKTDTIPFSSTGTYNGDTNPFAIKIGRDTTVAVGRDGSDAFGTVFSNLTDFKTALENNDVGGIQSAISDLDTDMDRFSEKISDIGSKTIRLETKEKILADLQISSTDRLSTLEDADIAAVITDLKAKEVAYQAALASASRVIKVTLVDYLK